MSRSESRPPPQTTYVLLPASYTLAMRQLADWWAWAGASPRSPELVALCPLRVPARNYLERLRWQRTQQVDLPFLDRAAVGRGVDAV